MREKVTPCAQTRSENMHQRMQEAAEKVSLNWARLIARIYEVDPLICEACGKKIKIIAFVIHSAQIRRILSGISWPTEAPEFDPPYEPITWDICQMAPGTSDGFPEIKEQMHSDAGPDPPHSEESCDPPHWEDTCDPPHWEN